MARPSQPLADLTFSVVGPGRVGTSLAAWARQLGATLVSVAGRPGSAGGLERGAGDEGPGGRRIELGALESAGQDLLLVTVPDPALEATARELARRPQARVALHAAGALPAEVLAPLRPAGCALGTLHPLRAFPRPRPELEAAAGVVFAIDGDPDGRALARRLAAAWRGRPIEIAGRDRRLYHLAATLAAGGVATLISAADEIARRSGLPREVLGGYLALARSALDEVELAREPARAITGPAARGDRETLAGQLEAIGELSPELAETCLQLARETRRQLRRLRRTEAAGEAEEDPLEGLLGELREGPRLS